MRFATIILICTIATVASIGATPPATQTIAIPQYGVSYGSYDDNKLANEIAELKKEIAELKAMLGASKLKTLPHVQLMEQTCIQCHTKDTAKKGSPILFDENNKVKNKYTKEEVYDMLKATKNGKMPKGKPYTDRQFSDFLSILD